MKRSWDPITPGSWVRSGGGLLLLAAVACALHAQPVRTAGARTSKPQAAKAVPTKSASGAGLLAIAQHQLDSGDLDGAVKFADAAGSKTPALDDYAQWIVAQAEFRSHHLDEVSHAAARVLTHAPLSPFVGPAAALAVQAALQNDKPKDAQELVTKYKDQIPSPQNDLLLAQCLQASGDLPQAAEYFQRVYYDYPVAKEAVDAANALVDLKGKLGDAFPPAMPAVLISRAQKLFDAGRPAAAKIELAAAINQLGGAERDLARVRLGVADYLASNVAAAFQYLSALKVDDAEADAERLSYLVRSTRKMDRHGDIKPFLAELEKTHATSPWRMDALIFAADQARVDNDPGTFLPLYRACAATFASEKRASWCQWRIAFDSYQKDTADAGDLLRTYVEKYPQSDDANDALYFLGRWYERKNDLSSARACYEQISRSFPNTYYAVAARERLKDVKLQAATADAARVKELATIAWPSPPQFPSFSPGPLAQERLDRVRLLQMAELGDWAEGELRFGARNDGEQENVYAMELARMAMQRGAPDQAMRSVRTYAPGYLYMPLDQAPVQFWQLAFPIPFRSEIEEYSRAEGLDPFLVAALIRQESEFNPKVISHANAYGLMQLLPTTGRELSRHFHMRRFNSSQLLVPDHNVQLGTFFFHNLLNSYGGQLELALASYNAGPGRASLWRTWGPFREQAEFIETVPFHETRGYIQLVLRNADVYRRLYANSTPDVPVYHPKPAPKTSVKRRAAHHRSRLR